MKANHNFEGHLLRHSARRNQGLPTVSVLIGPPAAAVLAWRRWSAQAGLLPVTHTLTSLDSLIPELFAHIACFYDLAWLSLRYLSVLAGVPIPSCTASSRTARDIEQLVAAASTFDPDGTARVARDLIHFGKSRPVSKQLEPLDNAINDLQWPQTRVLRAISGLLSGEGPPAILLIPRPSNCARATIGADFLGQIAAWLARTSEVIPKWHLGVSCTPDAFEQWAQNAPASRAKSMMMAGQIEVAVVPVENFPSGDRWSNLSTQSEESRFQLDEDARSAAEQFLFQQLQTNPRTKGRFLLNGTAEFKFGSRLAEVDLIARDLKLAVEVDGYYHFINAEAYRRDRRKDWELQRHGYTVIRVLAEDVVARMENVLDTILAAVNHCDEQP